MQKRTTTGKRGLVDEIEDRAHKRPYQLNLTDRDKTTKKTNNIDARILFYQYSKSLNIKKWSKGFRTSMKNKDMDAMIRDKVWDIDLAKKLNISPEEVIHHFSVWQHLNQMINFELEEEWRSEVLRLGREYYPLEIEKAKTYLTEMAQGRGGKLRKFLYAGRYKQKNITPRTIVEKELFRDDNDSLKKLHEKIQLSDQKLQSGELSESKFKQEVSKFKIKIKNHLHRQQRLFRELFADSEANERFVCIRASEKMLYGTTPKRISLKVSTVRHGKDLLDHNVKWFNNLHDKEIQEAKIENRKDYDKERYDSKPKVVSKRDARQLKIDRVLELNESGLSSRKISEQMELEGMKVGKTTVLDWIEKYGS